MKCCVNNRSDISILCGIRNVTLCRFHYVVTQSEAIKTNNDLYSSDYQSLIGRGEQTRRSRARARARELPVPTSLYEPHGSIIMETWGSRASKRLSATAFVVGDMVTRRLLARSRGHYREIFERKPICRFQWTSSLKPTTETIRKDSIRLQKKEIPSSHEEITSLKKSEKRERRKRKLTNVILWHSF